MGCQHCLASLDHAFRALPELQDTAIEVGHTDVLLDGSVCPARDLVRTIEAMGVRVDEFHEDSA